ncbi:MAG TPA: dephospho-CoA kinase [Candidatus Eisenbacteria bacterium]|nr:dephospho-CoA kinase [Candidatus Eisenbacteria bacterium]
MTNGPLIGLTGGIGSGKSTVATILADLGAHVIDADKIGHEVYLPGTEGWERVVGAFGRGIVAPDGTIDRKQLGARVFADPAALRRLNALVHPLIGEEIRRRIAAARANADGRPIVVEAAIMLEAGWRFFDRIWVVVVERDTAVVRCTASRALTREDVERRIDAQMSNAERRQAADLVIDNNGSLAELRAQVEKAWHALRA